MGHFLQGNVALTIVNVAESDRGHYCCRVENKRLDGGAQTLTNSLQGQPGKLALFPCLLLTSYCEPSPLFANNLFFSRNKETKVLINMRGSEHLLLLFFWL